MKCMLHISLMNEPDRFEYIVKVSETKAREMMASGDYVFVPKKAYKAGLKAEQERINEAG